MKGKREMRDSSAKREREERKRKQREKKDKRRERERERERERCLQPRQQKSQVGFRVWSGSLCWSHSQST